MLARLARRTCWTFLILLAAPLQAAEEKAAQPAMDTTKPAAAAKPADTSKPSAASKCLRGRRWIGRPEYPRPESPPTR